MRTIRVTGKGQLRLKPDLTRITITLEGSDSHYDETLRKSAEDSEQLRTLLLSFGFAKEDLKTLSFHVEPQYEGYDDHGIYRQRFTGYRFQHTMKLEFGSDNALLGKILYALAYSPVHPSFQLSYTVKYPETAKNRLLGQAVRDARKKALVLSEAAGLNLRDIQSIDYSWGELNLETRPMNRMLLADRAMPMAKESFEMDIEPDDIEISDTVTVIWEIA